MGRHAFYALTGAARLVSNVALAEAPQKVKPTGLFSDMRWVAEAGDVLGTEILVVYSLHGTAAWKDSTGHTFSKRREYPNLRIS
jgi:hypothetical protein